MDQFQHPSQRVSIEPLGHIEVRAFQKSRKVVKAWPLLTRCFDTGAVMCLLVDFMETKSVANALLRVQLRVGRIDKVCMDKGTNMFAIKRIVGASDCLLQLKEAKDHPVDTQFRYYCERSVQVLKKIIRMMCRTLRNQKLPLLEKEEATLLIETASFQVNSVPYGPEHKDLYLSPNDILVPTFQLYSLTTTSSPLHNIDLLINKLKVYDTEIQLEVGGDTSLAV